MNTVVSILDTWTEIEDVNRLDGVRVSFTDSSWVLIRPSGTEPIIRITVEALSAQRAKKLLKDAKTALKRVIK